MDVMRSFLDRYKDIIEFCQIQLNWIDWDFQNAKEMVARGSLPCTACRYCTSGCPVELLIPELIDAYNEDVFTGYGFRLPNYFRSLPEGHGSADCISCGSCEAVCPQGIKISAAMEDMVKRVADNPRF